MIFPVKNGMLDIGSSRMPYLRFGSGHRALLLLPGLGEGLQSIRGMALPFAAMYRMYAREHTVYVLGRRDSLAEGFSTRDMAADAVYAMDALGIGQADVVGISMGGMIAQFIAADHPDRVRRLVLGVSAAQPNDISREAISSWIAMAQEGDHAALMADNMRRMYSAAYLRRNGWMVPIVARFTKPRSYAKFLTMAQACLTHDSTAVLSRITAPTLVIGGAQDNALGSGSSPDLAARIPGAQLNMYPDLGHSAYEEAPDFNQTVLHFFQKGVSHEI